MPGQPLSCGQLVASVIANPQPLLFLDTAAILDVSRVPFRHELQVDIVDSAAILVHDALIDSRRVWSVTTENVMQEFEANRASVAEELRAHISRLRQSMARVSRVAKIMFPEHRIELTLQERSPGVIEERLLGVMDRLVESLVRFEGTPECVYKARNRVLGALPPASKAQQQYKDCEIFEQFLELLRLLRHKGFDRPAIFVTPNNKDYESPPEGYPQIHSDLATCGGKYASNLSWAYSLIRQAAL